MDIRVNDLKKYIRENTRADNVSGINYIDPKGYESTLEAKQNYVVYGRRGAGKSSLLKTLDSKYFYISRINIEDYKDISFPNILIKILIEFYSQSIQTIEEDFRFWQFKRKGIAKRLKTKINNEITDLSAKLTIADNAEKKIRQKKKSKDSAKAGASVGDVGLSAKIQDESQLETEETKNYDKLSDLKLHLDKHKKTVKEITEFASTKPVYLILDDLYFMTKDLQPLIVDYLHRLTKGNDFYLKIGTIKHRSKLYSQNEGKYVGMEHNADIYSIDLDYTLDKWNELKQFMQDLIREAIQSSKCHLDFDDLMSIFNANSFNQLCMASGGVPRDFLVLLTKCLDLLNDNKNSITVTDVRDIAITNYKDKVKSLSRDSTTESEILEMYIQYIVEKIYKEKRTNIFLIDNIHLENNLQVKQAIRELIDLRFLHLVDNNTSKSSSDGRKYSAIMLDTSLYDNSRPRNFTEVLPGVTDDKGRKDEIRSRPRINVSDIEEFVKINTSSAKLIISEEK